MFNQPAISRRTMLKTVAMAGAASVLPTRLFGQRADDTRSFNPVLRYLESLARPAGGYAWED